MSASDERQEEPHEPDTDAEPRPADEPEGPQEPSPEDAPDAAEEPEPGEAVAEEGAPEPLEPDRRPPKRRTPCLLLAVLGVTLGAVAGLAMYVLRPGSSAQGLLEKTLAAYQEAQAFHGKGTVEVDMSMGGAGQKQTVQFESHFQRPNRFRTTSGMGSMSTTMVCDGDHIYVDVPMLQKVLKMPAPPSISEMPAELSQGFGGTRPGLDVKELIDGKYSAEALTVASGIPPDDEWLSSLEAPEGTVPVTTTDAEGRVTALWIDSRTRTIRQVAAEMSVIEQVSEEQLEAMGGDEGNEQFQAMMEQFRNMTMKVVARYDVAEFDPELPPDTFAFKPPDGAEVVEGDNMRDLMMSAGPSGDEKESDLLGQPAPDFEAQDLDGKPVKLSSFRGSPVVLDFWATWCPPCKEELPILSEIHEALKDKGLKIVAVSTDQDIKDVKEFLEHTPLPFTVLHLTPEADQAVSEAYNISGIPRVVFIDGEGTVKADVTGMSPKQDILEHIAELGVDTAGAQ